MEEKDEITLYDLAGTHSDILNEMSPEDKGFDSETRNVNMLLDHIDANEKLRQDDEQFKEKMKLENRKLDIEEERMKLDTVQKAEDNRLKKTENTLKKVELGVTLGVAVLAFVGDRLKQKNYNNNLKNLAQFEIDGRIWRSQASRIHLNKLDKK